MSFGYLQRADNSYRTANGYNSTKHVDAKHLGDELIEFLDTHPQISKQKFRLESNTNIYPLLDGVPVEVLAVTAKKIRDTIKRLS